MAYNDNKIFEILKSEINKVPERYDEYQERLHRLLKEVINIEREHSIARTDVVKKVADLVNKAGKHLYDNSSDSTTVKEDK